MANRKMGSHDAVQRSDTQHVSCNAQFICLVLTFWHMFKTGPNVSLLRRECKSIDFFLQEKTRKQHIQIKNVNNQIRRYYSCRHIMFPDVINIMMQLLRTSVLRAPESPHVTTQLNSAFFNLCRRINFIFLFFFAF